MKEKCNATVPCQILLIHKKEKLKYGRPSDIQSRTPFIGSSRLFLFCDWSVGNSYRDPGLQLQSIQEKICLLIAMDNVFQ